MGSQMRCVVPECNYMEQEYIKFHGFPKDPTRCRAWTDFCDRDPVRPKSLEAVCDRHFREEDYQPSYKILERPRKWWRLKLDAVPTLFGPEVSPIEEEVIEVVPEDIQMEIVALDHLLGVEDIVTGHEEEVEEEVGNTLAQCRLCLNVPELQDDRAVDLFSDNEGRQGSLAIRLLNFLQIELEDSPQWPSTVCGACVEFIGQIDLFKDMILSSHCQLSDQIVKDTSEEEILLEYQEDISEEVEEPEEEETLEESKLVAKKRIFLKRRNSAKNAKLRLLMRKMDLLKCSLCGVDYPSLESLHEHMRCSHNLSNSYIVCCGEKRPYKSKALDHLEYHLDEDAFKCDLCGDRLENFRALKSHKVHAHKALRSFDCSDCDKSFPTKTRLEKHRLIHLPKSERPVECAHCESRFCNKAQLRRHIERMHDVQERHACDLCGGLGFSNYYTYWEHVHKKHKKNASCAGERCLI